MRRALCTIAVALVVLSACGDDGTATAAEDQDAVDRAVLALSDLPSGWAYDESDDDDSDDELDLPAECDDLEAAVNQDAFDGQTAEATSPSFIKGAIGAETVQVTLDAQVAAGENDGAVSDVFELFDDDRVLNCLDDAFKSELEQQAASGGLEGVDIGAVSVNRPEPPNLGDESTAVRVGAVLSYQGAEFPFTADIVGVRQGRFAVSLSVVTIGEFTGEDPDIDVALRAMLDRLP